MNQSARFMWYHDHAVGITRLNAYAGVASGMLIRDKFEAGLIDGSGGVAQGLPPYIETSVLGGKTVQELPIVVQDKIFVGPDIAQKDPTWGLSTCSPSRRNPAASGMPTSTRRAPDGSAGGTSSRWIAPPRSVGYPRILWRHDARERHHLPGDDRPGTALPAQIAQRLQRPFPQPPALYR